LSNDGVLSTASIFTEYSEKTSSAEWYFITKLGPQVSLFSVPIFGVNRDPVASGVKCEPLGGMNSKMKSWTVS
jgi:hypothetical protein